MDEYLILSQIKVGQPPLAYNEFRTGLTFAEVYYMIYNRPHKRRHGVLGKWREIKLAGYEKYLNLYHEANECTSKNSSSSRRRTSTTS